MFKSLPMNAMLAGKPIYLPPGSVIRRPGTWQEYDDLRQKRGDGSLPRMKFWQGEILLMSPLPQHGREAHLLASLVTILLDNQGRNYEAFTPITMDIPPVGGIEPDYCFYIDNWQVAVGKNRMDWQTDPPPDLVLEIEVTSYTRAADYAPYGVPEVWLYKNERLQMYCLEGDRYRLHNQSRYFPDIHLSTLVAQVVQTATEKGTGVALRQLRQELSS